MRMVPDKNSQASHGPPGIKGHFAWGYATHPDITKPMIHKHQRPRNRKSAGDEGGGVCRQRIAPYPAQVRA